MLSPLSTDEYQQLRQQMVERQLRARGVRDPGVLHAMSYVPRHEFVPFAWRQIAYGDHPVPIGFGQTISQPLMVATMCEVARLVGNERVLEVGTGSGYGAAVLSLLASQVHTVERITELADEARDRLSALGYTNVTVHSAKGELGWPEAGPYDAILVTAGAKSLPQPFLDQLSAGGRIVIPIGHSRHNQTLFRVTWDGQTPNVESFGGCAFVPLIEDRF